MPYNSTLLVSSLHGGVLQPLGNAAGFISRNYLNNYLKTSPVSDHEIRKGNLVASGGSELSWQLCSRPNFLQRINTYTGISNQ
jgi:hypothetical protein